VAITRATEHALFRERNSCSASGASGGGTSPLSLRPS